MNRVLDPVPVGTPSRLERRLVSLSIAAAVLMALTFTSAAYWKAHRFDRARWLAVYDSENGTNVRSPMLDDILQHHLKVGMSRAHVRALLGNPSGGSCDGNGPRVDRYGIGNYGWSAFDPSVLELRFDRAGRVAAVRIYET